MATITHPHQVADQEASRPEDEVWFANFGYKPSDDVPLRHNLGLVPAAEVWRVRKALIAIQAGLPAAAFRRICDAAVNGYPPYDPEHEFSSDRLALTEDSSGEFLPKVGWIIAALVDIDEATGTVVATFADEPFLPARQAA